LQKFVPRAALSVLLIVAIVAVSFLIAGTASAKWPKVFFIFNLGFFGIVASKQQSAQKWESVRFYVPFLALLVVVLLVGLLSAPAIPSQNTDGDEAAWTNYAITWLQTGNLYYKIMGVEPLPITPGVGYGVTVYARWIEFFGVSIASGRVFIWLIHFLAVICIGFAGWRLYDRQIGILAALLAASSPLLLAQRIIRPEIGLPIIGALLFVTYRASQERPWWGFVSGWLAVFSLEIHAAGVAYIVGIIGLYLYDGLQAWREQRTFLLPRYGAFALGLLFGAGSYILFHVLILEQPARFFEDLRSNRLFLTRLSATESVLRIFTPYIENAPTEVLFFAVGFLGLILRRRTNDKYVVCFWVFSSLGYYLFVPRKGYYLALFAPFVTLSIATLLRDGFERRAFRLTAGGLAICAMYIFCTSGQFIAVSSPGISLSQFPAGSPLPIDLRIRALSKPGSKVVGNILSYWGLLDYPHFYASEAEYDPAAMISGEDPYARWQRLAPDVVFHTFYPAWPIVPPLLEKYMQDEHFRLVDTFTADGYITKVWWHPNFQLSYHRLR
jgi:hypothetical protein